MTSRIITLFLAAALIGGCATSPEGRMQLRLIPSSQMASLGAQSFEQIKAETPQTKDAATQRYIRCIADAIIPHIGDGTSPADWEVLVFADSQANAFALPGRKIGVYEGLLKYAVNQHQVATVMGHEVAHVIAGHGNERLSNQMAAQAGMALAAIAFGSGDEKDSLILAGLGLGVQYGVILPFSRSHESEADLVGLNLMARAGFDPRESVPLWQNMASSGLSPPEFLSTHPSSTTRIKDLTGRIPQALQLRGQAQAKGYNPNCTR